MHTSHFNYLRGISLLLLFLSFIVHVSAQKLSDAVLEINTSVHDYGKVELANSLVSKFIITNAGKAKLYILRADAENEYKISITKKILLPTDTATLIVAYQPRLAGPFTQTIRIFTNAEAAPAEIFIKGELKKLDDDKTQCYYFGQPKKEKKVEQVLIPIPDKANKPLVIQNRPLLVKDTVEETNSVLPLSKYKPNHVVFLIDVSRSMRDSLKLPLLKYAIEKLIHSLRNVDRLSLIAYNDSARLLGVAVPATERAKIVALLAPIKANGRTNGSRGIRLAHKVALANFQDGANNQIILATDGAFILSDADFKLFINSDKKVILSVMGFGDDKKYLLQLNELAQKCNGHYMHLANQEACDEVLLREIRQNSER